MNTNQQAVVVPPAPGGSGMEDIRGLKPLVDVPGEWLVFWLVAAALVLGLLLVLGFLWWRSRRHETAPPPPVVPAHVIARQQLERALGFISDPRAFCIRVSGAIRTYLEQRFEFHAPERTTEEFLSELQETDRLTPDQKQSLGEFLQRCDLVKFARFEPDEAALHELHGSACRLVDETRHDPLDMSPTAAAEVLSAPVRTP